jgi:uncharacterized membrane protein (UPF0136 family)
MSHSHPVDKLIGPLEENFYSLGIKDRDGFNGLLNHLKKLSKTDLIQKVISTCLSATESKLLKKNEAFNQIIEHYCQGLNVAKSEFLMMIFLPEVISSQSKWIPDLLSIIPGCSSLFTYDKTAKGPIHSRILDFPLIGQYEKYERSILMDIEGLPKILSHSSRGYPIPGMTSVNEHGLSIAIHQKFSDYFNFKGEPIIKIAFDIITQAKDVNEAKKILRSKTSMTYWGIYLCDGASNVLAVDICGNELYTEKFDLKENNHLYFNNIPLFRDKINNSAGPSGYQQTCQMKCESFEKNFKSFKWQSKDIELESLKVLTKLSPLKKSNAKEWKQKPITPASVQVSSFNINLQKGYLLSGDAPKSLNNEVIEFENIFGKMTTKLKKTSLKNNQSYIKGLNLMSQAQGLYDCKSHEQAYHKIQMARVYFDGLEEACITEFFFIIWQYLFAETKDDFRAIYAQFQLLENKLPEFLEDHRLLFINRVEKICSMKSTIEAKNIKSEQLRLIFEKESKLRVMVIKLMRKLTYPRLELPDIIYMY